MDNKPKQMDQKDLDFFKKLLLEKIAQTSDDVEAIENTSRNDARKRPLRTARPTRCTWPTTGPTPWSAKNPCFSPSAVAITSIT